MNTKIPAFVWIFLLLPFFSSCSSGSAVIPPAENMIQGSTGITEPWNWGNWIINISETHDSIEVIPIRETNWHFNVLNFLEKAPCVNCLKIGPPVPQPDGTVKFKVTLRHPFPGHREFTGFDVRGVAIFPATRYWNSGPDLFVFNHDWKERLYPEGFPFYFSLPEDGGAFLLNNEGFTFYFAPNIGMGEGLEQPIFNYQQGKYATSEWPDGTINPYILFDDGSDRHMFKTTDTIQRTYHLQLPPGNFAFGYSVIAAWVPPEKMPVNNPAEDFSMRANSEDVVNLTFEQYAPLDPNSTLPQEENFFARITGRSYPPAGGAQFFCGALFSLDIGSMIDPPEPIIGVAAQSQASDIGPFTYENQMRCRLPKLTSPNPYINGLYPALLISGSASGKGPHTMAQAFSFKVVYVNLQASDG